MPGQESAPKYDDWLKKVYSEMNWKFHDLVGGARKKRSTSVTSRPSEATVAIGQETDEDTPDWTIDPDIADYVVAGTPAEERKKRPLTAALSDAGIRPTEGFTERLNSYQSQKSHYDEDPLGAAYADPEAVKWDRLVKGTLGESDSKARQMVLMQHEIELKKQSRQLTREAFQDQATAPEFRAYLRQASDTPSNQMETAQRETIMFFSQNMKVLGNELVATTNELMHEKAFGDTMMKTLHEAKANAVTDREKKRLAELEEEAIAYGTATSKQMAFALNCTNCVEAAISRGAEVEAAVLQLSDERPKAVFASSGLQRTAEEMVHTHLGKSNNVKKTLAWAETQPWAPMVKVSIKKEGREYSITSEQRTAPETQANTGDPMVDNHVDMPHKAVTKTDLANTPELVFNGLRSDQMMASMSHRETGEKGPDDVPFVGIPSEASMAWAKTLLTAQKQGQDISDQLPDYMEVKEVWYRENRSGLKGKLKRGKPEKKVHVVTYKDTSESVQAAQKLRTAPKNMAGDLADLADNMADLKADQARKAEKLQAHKAELEKFLSSKGEGLLESFGEAHEAFDALQKNILDQVIAKMGKGTSLKNIKKWASKQPWAMMFEIEFKPDPNGKKNLYNVVVKEKEEEVEETDGASEGGRTETDGSSKDHEASLTGALAALSKPAVQKELILKYTGEKHNGVPIVDKPSDLAKKWAEMIMKVYGSGAKLPAYLVLRDVVYKSKSRNLIRRGNYIPCKAVEFIESKFKQ
ncbi:hypothetical protein SAMN04488518_104128 [Pseudovibrio ascidiaceicola]|uniref:Uncharacterized protein n=1 Tax=Pseudovibrio ascidiaceicola TaxID=285279 RepID=A0A1I3YNG8_9HYPH|nr:hypothetical protein [Pseudovibrio ascidiaceicola]SFK33320.1 hypothetical protein SAMN04488518_104128 [Pseudovibrio ascidiaceicola]